MGKKNKLKAAPQTGATKPSSYDRRAIHLPNHSDLAAVEIPDPFAFVDPAKLNDKNEWEAPRQPTLTVIQSFKKDPIGRMYGRRQIPYAEYKAAVDFQALHDAAQIGVIRALDPAKEYVDGGLMPDILTDRQQQAIQRIRAIEGKIRRAHGWSGITILNAVLVDKVPVEAAARRFNAETRRQIEFWSLLFRQCLHTLGIEMGTIGVRCA